MSNGIPSFIKWAGGKKQLLEQFKQFFPDKIENYYESFVGGGTIGFYLLKTHPEIKKIYLSDINKELVTTYKVVKNDINNLINLLKQYKEKHNKEFYYKIRSQEVNKLSELQIATRFIYLNKTCFNGLYRVNSKGQFNVPIGDYKNPTICQEEDLREISKLLQKDDISVKQFYDAVKKAKKGDFIYFDPPYYPLNRSSFTKYTKEQFLEKEQEKLAEVFKDLDKRGCKVMLSNSDTEFIKNLYRGYYISVVKATRMINCNATKRGKINEIVITNYLIQKKI
ncbi:D12 class N6 adenine-specific DNA methyltransferase [uncultured archaeon]|nr:D12 class N6 adenine-specific DNA methyltransferase [uncultured archaeon]